MHYIYSKLLYIYNTLTVFEGETKTAPPPHRLEYVPTYNLQYITLHYHVIYTRIYSIL